MTRVILDRSTSDQLHRAEGRVEVCDESGRTLGHFIPLPNRALYEGVEVPFTEEDLQRAEQEPGGYTTAEVLAHLKSLDEVVMSPVIWKAGVSRRTGTARDSTPGVRHPAIPPPEFGPGSRQGLRARA